MQYVHMKCGAKDVNSLGLKNLFYNDTRRTLRRLLMQEICNGLQSKEAPIDALDPASRTNTLAWVGLKGGGVVGRSFRAHSLRYSLAVGQHFVGIALAIGGS